MSQRFSYVKYDKIAIAKQEKLKALFEDIEDMAINQLADTRQRALLLTALEEAYMWSGKCIRDEQIIRDSSVNHVPERG